MKILLILAFSVFFTQCSSDSSKQETGNSGSDTQNQVQSEVEKGSGKVKTDLVVEEAQKPIDPKDIVSPLQSIKNLDKMIEDYHLGQNLTEDQLEANRTLKSQIIRGTFDINELCRLSLGKHWEAISAEQRKSFVNMMTQLLETKAIFSKEQLRGDNKLYGINYKNEVYDDKQKKKATVKSEMNVPKEKIKLDITYKMLLTKFGWKIFDVIVDDASLLSNYKFQFDRIITKNGFDDLMDRMKVKLTKIKGKKKKT